MGVPAFYRKLAKKYKLVRSKLEKPIRALYIDTNCLLHPQCFAILDIHKDLKDTTQLQHKMFSRIVEYIDYLIGLTNPTELVYIAIDGIAPVAKINQQRTRRFGYANNYRAEIYKRHGIKTNESWSNIVITPGTKFMYELHKKLISYYSNRIKTNKDKLCKYQIVYDSYMNPGEGEHKILQHLKNSTPKNNTDAIVIYGLDADLIFLAMGSQIPNIYLLRETSQMNRNDNDHDDSKSIEQELMYSDIDFIKDSINCEFNESYQSFMTRHYDNDHIFKNYNRQIKQEDIKKKRIDIKKFDFVNDYIFICYFLGNDFLPHLPSVDINANGLEMLIDVYLDVFQDLCTCLISFDKDNKVLINNEFLFRFISLIALKEEYYFKRILPEHLIRFRRRKCFETEPHKRELWEYENLKTITQNDPVKFGIGESGEWKFRYYLHYFKSTEHQNELINDLCQNYLEGLLWVAQYYFNHCESWRWQYRYTHAPFLSDIMEYLKHKNIKEFEPLKTDPVDMFAQLVSVVPVVYSDILPNALRYISSSINSPVIDMFPIGYDIDTLYKTQLYKCIPMIPYLDIDRVEQCVLNAKLSSTDLLYSLKCEPLTLGRCYGGLID